MGRLGWCNGAAKTAIEGVMVHDLLGSMVVVQAEKVGGAGMRWEMV